MSSDDSRRRAVPPARTRASVTARAIAAAMTVDPNDEETLDPGLVMLPKRPVLTHDGREKLEAKVRELRVERLAELRPLLSDPSRDERVVADFERTLVEAAELEQLLAEAEDLVRDPAADDGVVVLGSRVSVAMPDGSIEVMRPVHPIEAVLDDERVSVQSPLAKALMGHRVGDVVDVVAPRGRYQATIAAVEWVAS